MTDITAVRGRLVERLRAFHSTIMNEAADEIERLHSERSRTIETCAKVADLRAEVAKAAARLDEARLHDITDVHDGRAAIARDIAQAIRALGEGDEMVHTVNVEPSEPQK